MFSIRNELTEKLKLSFPLVMAPMFLVTNLEMMKQCIETGILGCFPSLNFRNKGELEQIIRNLNQLLESRKGMPGNYGVNLIVQKTNIFFESHLEICVNNKVPVYITSLGNPKPVIDAAHTYGANVFCDVTNMEHAKKCNDLGCDGFVAVGQGAGGHAGPYPLMLLIASLKKQFPDKLIMAAGGIAHGSSMLSVLAAGADAGYVGTRFIASSEATVRKEYMDAVLMAGMNNIVMTDRISGTPCTIINTEYAQKVGLHQTWLERYMGRNPRTKKYFKMLVAKRGMNWLEAAVRPGDYHKLWCAGQSVEMIDDIKPIKQIVHDLIAECDNSFRQLNSIVK